MLYMLIFVSFVLLLIQYIYNHIYKTKHSNSDKNLLYGEFLVSADMNNDSKINYLDYVAIYKKIKELKGEGR